MANESSNCLTGASPVDLAKVVACNHGFYCPNNTNEHPPQYCAPTRSCQAIRLLPFQNNCPEPQGIYEPIVCPKGSYCPAGGKVVIPCSKGHYCPLGTETPFRCGRLSICPPRSSRELALDGFLVALIFDLLILALVFVPTSKLFVRVIPRKAHKGLKSDESTCESQLKTIEGDIAGNPDNDPANPDSDGAESAADLQDFVSTVAEYNDGGENGLSIGFNAIGFTVEKHSKRLISAISGKFEKGTLCGILGPSGAGKSTFMKVMMGKLEPTEGFININGHATKLAQYKKLIGFVPAEDVLLPELTVRENILHSARVRLPRNQSDTACQKLVDNLISCLGLSHVQHQVVGSQITSSISSGQKRRVSIGMELVAAPVALFLDEPTSGLDSATALSIMRLLKAISRTGVTVICILHQPREEIFEALDQVLLLAQGRQLYQGPVSDASNYFCGHGFRIPARSNPADVLLDIAAGRMKIKTSFIASQDLPKILAETWEQRRDELARASVMAREIPTSECLKPIELARIASVRGALWHRQTYLCFVRAMKQQFRQPSGLLLEIGVGGIAGLLIGLGLYPYKGMHFQGTYLAPFELLSSAVDYSTVPKIGQMIALAIALAAAAPGVSTFGEEKSLYWREASVGHSRSAYFVGKVLSTIPRTALSALHFTSFYAILSTPLMAFWITFLLNMLYFYCVYGLASFVSTAVKRENGTLLAMILCLIIGAFGGYAPPLSTIQTWRLEWLWRMCPGTWLSEAYVDQTLKQVAYLYDTNTAARWTGYTLGRTPLDIAMIFLIGTAYRVAAFLGLLFFDRNKQR
ncbi:uncharacterized protein BDR25DRAFT_262454 [Lindgomyces ingoldianus]|uniref:Uncharacterized protein n=1 Tax=Lindgomyces ingoldianus TaxID=673940 RepID=A0ACB6QU52_9PLEO|nr:uncharacterized protein BDR25DRAFT_262454 [Lindgomyces ingoldianus]KAF2470518.1 hypothetical protein BDR25DRAFT_262454 [Lindgomyces ingoldianus]